MHDSSPDLQSHRLSVLIPVYNSEETIGGLVDSVVSTLSPHIHLQEIILVNDGSADDSHQVILQAVERHPEMIRYIRLYRNFGEHNAVMCGLRYVTGDSVAVIDDDFQNPPSEILLLVQTLLQGYDVVYSYYERKEHSWFRNFGSKFNDLVATIMLDKPRNLYLSSFKVIDRSLVRHIVRYEGPYPYIDGLILRSTRSIGRRLVQHSKREAGKSGYTLVKLIRLWMNMFTGFSILPLRVATYVGFGMSFLAIVMTLIFIASRFVGPFIIQQEIPPGWASLIVVITLFAGVQLSTLGIIGEYLGRLFLTMNGSPQYLVRDTYGIQEDM